MREEKSKRLEGRGWKVGSVNEFLNLSPEEAAYIELKLKLADGLREHRRRRRLTQVEFARMVKSSQSRVAKMEAGDPSVTPDRSSIPCSRSARQVANSPRSSPLQGLLRRPKGASIGRGSASSPLVPFNSVSFC